MSLVRLQLLLFALLAVARPSLGAAPDDGGALQSWMLAQIQAGKDIDFNQRCGTDKLDPHSTDDPRWSASCRSVDPDILRALLTRPGLADAAPHGVRLRGARIDGTLNLDDAHVAVVEFTLIDCSLVGDLLLTTAHIDGGLIIDNTIISGRLNAGTAHIDRGIYIRNKTLIERDLALDAATVGDFLTLEDTTLGAGMSATALQVSGGGLGVINSEFDGDAMLAAAHVHGLMGISGTKFKAGTLLNLTEAKIDGPLSIQTSEFGGDADFTFTTVSEDFSLLDVTIATGKQLNAFGLRIGGFLGVKNVEFGGGATLAAADIHDYVVMTDVKFPAGAPLIATRLHVGDTLRFATPTEFLGGISLNYVNIGGDVEMGGTRVGADKAFDANDAQIGGSLTLRTAEFGGDVHLDRTNVRVQVNFDNTKFAPKSVLTLENLHTGQDFFFRGTQSTRLINAVFLAVAGNFDLRGSTLGGLDLSGASVAGDLRLGGDMTDKGQEVWTKWAAPDGATPWVVLRNAKVGDLQDDEHSWDGTALVLEGFTYGHLGGAGGLNRQDMRYRKVSSWRDWLDRDPVYSPQPYTQLASVLVASGNSEAASEIRYAGRERQRNELLRGCHWLHPTAPAATAAGQPPCDPGGWLGLSVLQVTVGYGIGTYTFRALLWTLGLTVAGTVILAFAPGVRGAAYLVDRGRAPRQKSLLWCFGATLNHVLPVVSLNPEFNDFFNDPKRERLYPWQQIVFAVLALSGWALSFFVIAALSGLTQG